MARGWWIAVLFAIGSVLFALGSVPGYASAVGARGDTVTYFVGSLFFTSASFLSYREAVDAASPAQNPAHRRFFTYQPGRIDWWATAIQLAGTVYFNVSTGVAMAGKVQVSSRISDRGRSRRTVQFQPSVIATPPMAPMLPDRRWS